MPCLRVIQIPGGTSFPADEPLGVFVHTWLALSIEDRRTLARDILTTIDVEADQLVLRFKAGLTVPAYLEAGRLRAELATPLAKIGFGPFAATRAPHGA